MPQAQSVIKSS